MNIFKYAKYNVYLLLFILIFLHVKIIFINNINILINTIPELFVIKTI
jgi:hypothetical protein